MHSEPCKSSDDCADRKEPREGVQPRCIPTTRRDLSQDPHSADPAGRHGGRKYDAQRTSNSGLKDAADIHRLKVRALMQV